MTVQTQLTEKEFIHVSFVFFYRKPVIKILTIVAVFGLLIVPLGLIFMPESFQISNLIFPVLLCVFFPFSIYSSARKGYRTNPQLREKVIYHFDDDKLFAEGETYTTLFQWKDITEVTQTKEWILIWQNKQKAMPVKTKDLWGGQIADLKEILDKNRVKNKLKYMS